VQQHAAPSLQSYLRNIAQIDCRKSARLCCSTIRDKQRNDAKLVMCAAALVKLTSLRTAHHVAV
jgi:hypothetical protein